MKIDWNGEIPVRRYAIFNSIIYGDYMVVIAGNDINHAEKCGSFVKWVGGIRSSETRKIKRKVENAILSSTTNNK